MIAPLLALALGAQPRVFLSVDRAFLPDSPGAVVRAELEGASTLDVRLYQLKDPEHFLGGGDEGPIEAAPPPGAARAASAPAVLARGAASMRHTLHEQLEPLLTDAARDALRLLAPGTLVAAPRELPFLRGEPLLRRWTLPCGANEAHRYCDVELGALPSGVYLVEGVAGTEAAYAVVLVSRLALAARHVPGDLVLFAADARSGEPRSDVSVELTLQGAPPLRGMTNAQGVLSLKPSGHTARALAHAGSDWAVLDLPAVAAHGKGPRIWLAPTRGEARPGERVRFVGAERPPPAAPRDLAVWIEDGRGTVVAIGTARQDAMGLLTGSLQLPAEAAPGLAHVVASVEGRQVAGEIWIRNAPKPDLTASAELDVRGPKARALVEARDETGAPVAGQVEWRLLRTPLDSTGDGSTDTEVVDEGDATLGTDGRAHFAVELPNQADASYVLDAAAIDDWGHRASCETTAVELIGPVHVALSTDRRVFAPGESPRLHVQVSDSSGAPAAAHVTVRTHVSHIGAAGETATAVVGDVPVEVPATGRATVSLAPLEPGYYEVEASVGETRVAEAVLFASAKGGDIPFTPDALTLVPNRARYTPGETARVLLFAPFESGSALVTEVAGDMRHQEIAHIHGSSAVVSFKVPAGASSVSISAVAILNGQSFAAERAQPVVASQPPALQLTLTPARRAGRIDLAVHVSDALGHPVQNAEVVAAVRSGRTLASLAPAIGAYFDPPPAPEGRTDVSLDFRSAGTTAAEESRVVPLGAAAFTPEKGTSANIARAPHALLDVLERLPPTDRLGNTRLTFVAGDARSIAAEAIAAIPAADPHAVPALLQSTATRSVPGVSAEPEVPPVLRANDRALARVKLLAIESGGSALVGGRPVEVKPGAPVEATISLDPQHPEYRVDAAGRNVLTGRVPVDSGEEWVAVQAGEAPPGTGHLADDSEESTLRLRIVSGPAGLLRLLAESHRPEPKPAVFELLEPEPLPRPELDARLSALALAIAAHPPRADLAPISAAAAAVIAELNPAGELGAYSGAPFDRARTAIALWLLEKAQSAGAGVPADWLERMGARLSTIPLRPDTGFVALARAVPPPELDAAELEDVEPSPLAALVLAAAQRKDPRADTLAATLEKRAGIAGNRACWSADGCDPRTPASIDSLSSTAWAVVALATARPRSPRIASALRYLMVTREQAVWGRGASGIAIPLALAAGHAVLPDRSATVRLVANGDSATARLEPGSYSVLYASGGPAQLRVAGGPVFFELAHARAEPTSEGGELHVERKFLRVRRQGDKVELEPLAGKVHRGEAIQVEIIVTGAAPHELVQIDDRFPGGLVPISQPGTRGPAAELADRGGAVTYANDRVHFDAIAGTAPTTVGYLARATMAGRFLAPATVAVAGELTGRSGQSELEVEDGP